MFAEFTDIIVDEVQKATNATIQKILELTKNATSRVGLSGTILEDKTADHYTLISSFGPIVARISQKELMDIGAATPVKIDMIILDYPESEDKSRLLSVKQQIKAGTTELEEIDLYKMELAIIRNHEYRLKWVCTLISKLEGNTLVLFIDVEGGYGKRKFETTKKINPKKEYYYIDGSVDANTRMVYKSRMEEGSNKVLCATWMTYGTAKSIKNLRNIVLVELMKGFNVIGQMVGRGMRLFDGKEYYRIFDLTDNLSIDPDMYNPDVKYNSILSKQGDTRLRHYIKEEFTYKITRVQLK
jgi:type I restriction enzyme R subunit